MKYFKEQYNFPNKYIPPKNVVINIYIKIYNIYNYVLN